MVSEDLKPSGQCARAAARANAVLGQLTRALHYCDRHIFVGLYKTHVRPHLEYAVQAWAPSLVRDIDVLEKVQRRAVGMVSGLEGRNYEQRLLELNLPSLADRRRRGDMITTHRILTGVDRVDHRIWFALGADQKREGATATRSMVETGALIPRVGRTELRRGFFTCRAPAAYNALPQSVRAATTINSFKNELDSLNQKPICS